MGQSRTKSILRYTMMPEILPRIRALGLHFGHFAYLLALVFSSARLIPHNHPVLNAANIGRFGVRQVIAMAANNVTWSMKNIDQIAIFGAIVMGLIMIVIQAMLIAVAALVGFNPAEASSVTNFFEISSPNDDLSLIFLSQVFGELGGFWGITSPSVSYGFASPIHNALHQMLSLYSMAMMVIAVIIVVYYIMTVVGEAAKTGTPFGQRFNSLWAPIRLVIALGLLVPMGSGLNAAQYVTLWVAKMGSGLGTQVWLNLADNINDTQTKQYVVEGFDTGWMVGIAQDIMRFEVCKESYNKFNAPAASMQFTAVSTDIAEPSTIGYRVEWVPHDPTEYSERRRICGSLSVTLPINNTDPNANLVPTDVLLAGVKASIDRLIAAIQPIAASYADYNVPENGGRGPAVVLQDLVTQVEDLGGEEAKTLLQEVASLYQNHVDSNIDALLEENKRQGWIAAGLWYMNIGRIIQGTEQTKEASVPISDMPNEVSDQQDRSVWNMISSPYPSVDSAMRRIDGVIIYNNVTAVLTRVGYFTLKASLFVNPITAPAAIGVAAYNYWNDGSNQSAACESLGVNPTGMGKVQCIIYTMIVPEELIILRDPQYQNLDPMAALVSAGGTIVDRAWKFVALGLTSDFLGSVATLIPGAGSFIAGILDGVGSLLVLIGLLGLSAGIVLFFLLPIMPFMYFFFAVVSWILEIFEAVIAMPLWALAHLRIDGDGMPGQAAINGYYLLLAILLRPALIVFGLIGGYIVFGAGVYLLQNMFTPLLSVVRQDAVNGLELLIFTLIYAYICYMLAIMCFKMVDLVPQQMLRWIGSGAQSFNDQKQDIGGTSQGAITGAAVIGSQLASTMSGGAKQAGQGVAKPVMERRQNNEQAEALGKQREFDSAQTDKIMGALGGGGDKGGTPKDISDMKFDRGALQGMIDKNPKGSSSSIGGERFNSSGDANRHFDRKDKDK